MTVDLAPVISALEDAGVAVAAVGLSVLLVCVVISIYMNLQLIFGFGSSSQAETNFHWDQREGESYDDFVSRNEAMDAGSVADDRQNQASVVSGAASEDYWYESLQAEYEADRLAHGIGVNEGSVDRWDDYFRDGMPGESYSEYLGRTDGPGVR